MVKVSLPRLEKPTLTGRIPWVTALLAWLEFPGSVIVQLECNCDDRGNFPVYIIHCGRSLAQLLYPPNWSSDPCISVVATGGTTAGQLCAAPRIRIR